MSRGKYGPPVGVRLEPKVFAVIEKKAVETCSTPAQVIRLLVTTHIGEIDDTKTKKIILRKKTA